MYLWVRELPLTKTSNKEIVMVESEWSVEDLEWRESVSDTCSLVPYVEEIGFDSNDEDLSDVDELVDFLYWN